MTTTNSRAKEHLVQYCKSNGWEAEDSDLLEVLREAKEVYREEVGQCRWWNEYLYVVEVEGVTIGYIYAEANRDESVSELGYEFDASTICEMRPVEKTITVYENTPDEN